MGVGTGFDRLGDLLRRRAVAQKARQQVFGVAVRIVVVAGVEGAEAVVELREGSDRAGVYRVEYFVDGALVMYCPAMSSHRPLPSASGAEAPRASIAPIEATTALL